MALFKSVTAHWVLIWDICETYLKKTSPISLTQGIIFGNFGSMYNGDVLDLLRQITERHKAVLSVADEAVRLGWLFANRFLSNAAEMPGPFRIRERRPIQNAYAVGWCRKLLQPFEESGVLEWVEEADTSTFRLEHDLAFRIKKTDRDGKASNIDTHRNDRILDYRQGSLFPNDKEMVQDLPKEDRWFTVGFVPDRFDIDLDFCGLSTSNGAILPFEQLSDKDFQLLAPMAWPSIVEARRLLA